MTSNIQAIIFDFGGVLIGWDPQNLYRRYFPDQPEAMEDFLKEVNFMEWNARQDKGRPFKDGVEVLSRQYPHRAELIRAYHEHWIESITGRIEGTVQVLYALKQKGYRVYGLSNWSTETFPLVKHEFDFLDQFDGVILSGEVKMVKPEPEIYEKCLQMVGRPADECLFIDDSHANILAADGLGFNTIHFRSAEQLVTELKARQLLPASFLYRG